MQKLDKRLSDWGYKVSTGPLVWNRHKEQLKEKFEGASYPIVWSESITANGNFVWKTEKKNHLPYLKLKNGDNWLITKKSCVLLQRTTSKEQSKRLIASVLPIEFIREKGGVVVENHLNMLIPIIGNDIVDPIVLSVFLNSEIVNDAFRCLSGSVAVSAYELESLPLPHPAQLEILANLIENNACQSAIEAECKRIYYVSE
ncbi:MAG: hypothetical protein JSU01_08815 [Bacteroidetes bacterium]|nr:hypothetical protein [Bacteroidota bacterium]